MVIDCERCAMRNTRHCDDCVVSAIVSPRRRGGVVLDAEEELALRELARAGLVPRLRMRRRRESA